MTSTAALVEQLEARIEECVDTYACYLGGLDDTLLAVARAQEESVRLGVSFAAVVDDELDGHFDDWLSLIDVIAEEAADTYASGRE